MTSSDESSKRAELAEELMREVRVGSSLGILFSQAVAERLGVHSTDIETVDLLHIFGPMTAGRLAEITGLTTGATTRLIDRMERAGFAIRRHDPTDRRRVVVEASMENAHLVMPLFEPITRRMSELWNTLSLADLQTVADFFRRANLIMSEENAKLRAQTIEETAHLGAQSATTNALLRAQTAVETAVLRAQTAVESARVRAETGDKGRNTRRR